MKYTIVDRNTAELSYGTNCTFKKPTVNKKYIKIISLCLVPAPTTLIYPGIKHPISHQLHDLWVNGYLDKLRVAGDRKNYYKATVKGVGLILEAVEKSTF